MPTELLQPPSQTRSRFIAALAAPLSIILCLALTFVLLALLPASKDAAATPFADSLKIIARTLYERVLLPRAPTASSGYRNWILTLQTATPILLTGLAVAVAFRANVLNIGAQGQYVAGAIAATLIGIHFHASPWIVIPTHLLCAAVAGAIFAMIAAALERWRNVPVVLSTLLLNFVAIEFLRYLLQGPMRARSAEGTLLDPQSNAIEPAAQLPLLFTGATGQGIHLGFFIAVVIALLLWFILRQTTFGFRLKVTGQNPVAARFAGYNVPRIAFTTLALSGALAGLAGSVQIAGIPTYTLFPDFATDGIGFTGIAVALLGRLSPVGVVFSAIFFGLLSTAFKALERSPLEIHAVTSQAVQGLLVIAILIVTSAKWRTLFKK